MPRRTNDARALVEAIAREHWERLFRIGYGVLGDANDAEEVVQEALLRALRVLKRRGEEAVPRDALSWMAVIVKNAAIDIIRRRQRERRAVDELPPAIDRGAADARARWNDVRGAVADLTPSQEVVVMLHAFEGRTFREIAEMLGEKESTVSMRYYRARTELRARLSEDKAHVHAR